MTDVFSKAKRSEVMARIRGRGNRDTELALAKLLRAHKIWGWRRQVLLRVTRDKWRVMGKARGSIASRDTRHPALTVRPDFVFLKSRTVIFVHGCFWHGCPKHATQPKNNRAFWQQKLSGNKRRDQLVTRTLRHAGWRVVRIWECALQRATAGKPAHRRGAERRLVRRIEQALR